MEPDNTTSNEGGCSNSDQIAAQLAAIASRLESMETLQEDVAALKAQALSRGKTHSGSSHYDDGDDSWRFHNSRRRPYTKINFPSFDGGDLRGWILKAEKYFQYYDVPDEDKVDVASMHLEGDALDLFSWLSSEQPISFWGELTRAFQKHFGPAEFQNPDEYLCSIKQTGSVQEYRQEFAKRLARVSNWPDNCLLGVFLNGLKEELKTDVRIHKPRTVYTAMSLALEYESKMNHSQPEKSSTWKSNSNSHSSDPNPFSFRISEDKKPNSFVKGKCYRCGDIEKLVDPVNIDNADTLSGVVDLIYYKALMKPTFAEISRLAAELPDFDFGDYKGRITSSSSVGVQETSKLLTIPVGISKNVSETSNKVEGPSNVADLSASKYDDDEEIRNSTQVIDNTPKVEVEVPVAEIGGSKEQVKESVEQNNTVPDVNVAPLKEHVNNIDGNTSGSISTAANTDVLSAETSSLNLGSSHDDSKEERMRKFDVDLVNSRESYSVFVPETSPLTSKVEATGLISPSSSSSKVKGNTSAKGKKKIKEILKNADARGTTDLYNAYKRPEEKKEPSSAAEIVENPNSTVNSTSGKSIILSSGERRGGPTKFEPDDWEDAADISGHKMEAGLKLKRRSEDGNDGMTKKYSRDFLLKFSDHCTDLPEGFEITPDTAEVFVATGFGMAREPYPSPGRGGGDRSVVGSRLDRRPSNRGNHGVLRTPRGQPPGPYAGVILPGPMQSPGPHMQRNNSDSERWQRPTSYQKGLMPSPHAPKMHKAERKYEVGKVTDEEQAKQRRLKSILNKLIPQNFEKLFDQVKQVNIDNADTLSGVIGQIFDKALMEPTFVEMYANFCSRLAVELPGFGDDNEKITFKRLLLNKCQEEFERGEREEEEANRTEEEGEIRQTEEEREGKRVKARRRMLGNIRLIGELYKKRMLTERIMHECINKLLGFNQKNPNPDEENIEALCKLMTTIGEMIDHPKAKEHMDTYFDMMLKLSNNMALSSGVRFMLKDAIDLRKNKWQQRRNIEEVHRDARSTYTPKWLSPRPKIFVWGNVQV